MPRRFVSWTFLIGFGIGSFVGVALALLAVALARPDNSVETRFVEITATAGPTRQPAAPTPTATPAVRTNASIEVRIGPGEAYAIIGSIGTGEAVDILGRNNEGDWVAISYPPGSAARGWLPASALKGFSDGQVTALAVLVPTPFSRTLQPTAAAGAPVATPPVNTPPGTPEAGARTSPTATGPRATPTPVPLHIGPTDLTIVGLVAGSDGSITVTIGNAGPGDVAGSTVSVLVTAGSESETLFVQPVMRAGDATDLRTSRIRISQETEVTATIDPSGLLADIDRGNNQRFATLVPKPNTTFNRN